MDTTGERLQKLIDALGVDRQEFSKRTGLPSGTLSNVINGKIWEKKGPPKGKLKIIAEKFPDTNIAYMKTGLGSPLLSDAQQELPISQGSGFSYTEAASLVVLYKYSPLKGNSDNYKSVAKDCFDIAEAMEHERLRRQKNKK